MTGHSVPVEIRKRQSDPTLRDALTIITPPIIKFLASALSLLFSLNKFENPPVRRESIETEYSLKPNEAVPKAFQTPDKATKSSSHCICERSTERSPSHESSRT